MGDGGGPKEPVLAPQLPPIIALLKITRLELVPFDMSITPMNPCVSKQWFSKVAPWAAALASLGLVRNEDSQPRLGLAVSDALGVDQPSLFHPAPPGHVGA